jgi:hypothetical protein
MLCVGRNTVWAAKAGSSFDSGQPQRFRDGARDDAETAWSCSVWGAWWSGSRCGGGYRSAEKAWRKGWKAAFENGIPTDQNPGSLRKPRADHDGAAILTAAGCRLSIRSACSSAAIRRAQKRLAFATPVVPDHVIVFNEASLYRHLWSLMAYFHQSRTHLSLGKDTPELRAVQPPGWWARLWRDRLVHWHHRG